MRNVAATFLAVLLLASAAAAQTAQQGCPHPAAKTTPSAAVLAARKAEHETCAADMTKFCANVPRGCGRPMQCLRAHAAELSTPCTSAITQLHAVRAQSRSNRPPL